MAGKNRKNKEIFRVGKDLGELLDKLEQGMELTGRILEVLKEDRYILRIWGYNILTGSEKKFYKDEEVDLVVKQISPHLVLKLKKKDFNLINLSEDDEHMDIIIR